MTSPQQHLDIALDALDHVKRICLGARDKTKRIDWIIMRCRFALEGKPWDQDYAPTPKLQTDKEILEQMRTIRTLQGDLNLVNARMEKVARMSAAQLEALQTTGTLFSTECNDVLDRLSVGLENFDVVLSPTSAQEGICKPTPRLG
ncbi:hypothetical protein ACKF11_13580 [Methylobacillus sp. Pita2]|uniref:hypothetical protein n=1 Tax=Methylobacillus sp. Pita2 TaxID=3383245 RepID=UPI0038B60B1A